jgi:hypothetical protein
MTLNIAQRTMPLSNIWSVSAVFAGFGRHVGGTADSGR